MVNLNFMVPAIKLVIDFIWKHVFCSNIRVEIIHLKDPATNQFKVDLEVKNAFQTNGFKWKTLSNDPVTGKRA